MVLNLRSLDWESSPLTTRPSLQLEINISMYKTRTITIVIIVIIITIIKTEWLSAVNAMTLFSALMFHKAGSKGKDAVCIWLDIHLFIVS